MQQADTSDAPWLVIAGGYIGLKELPGKLHNPTILGWLKRFAKNIGRWGKSRDETPWCSVFASHCLDAAGFPTTESALARSWVNYGKPSKFKRGAIVVIRRKKKGADRRTGSRGGYHVFFLLKVTKNFYQGRGGNQKNSVSDAWFSKKNYDLVAMRWPLGA